VGGDSTLRLVCRERSDFEKEMIHEIIGLRKPLFAICYGMQLLNVVLGGNLYQDIESQLPRAINHKENHLIEVSDSGPLPAGRYMVNSAHHQAVKALGGGLESLATSSDGLLEAFYMKDYPFLLGVQWHPERPEGLSDVIFGLFVEACSVDK
jgi:putative glutamine amidotransferase